MKILLNEFCKNSSVHGLHYLVNKNKSFLERVFWTIFLTAAAFVLVGYVKKELDKLYTSTVVAVVENPHYDLKAIEFPAITVCPNVNALDSKVKVLMESYKVNKENQSSFRNSLIALSLMRFAFYNLPQDYVKSVNGNVYAIKNEEITRIMAKIQPNIHNIMDNCTWRSTPIECKKLFRQQLTLEGFCYSFNSKTSIRSKEDPKDLPPIALPDKTLVGFKTSMFGSMTGLGFHLKSLAVENLNDGVFGDYYTIILHNPSLIPDTSNIITVNSNNHFNINQVSISISVTEAEKSLSMIEESLRDCSFLDESKEISCWLECRKSAILMYCQCLPYYLNYLMLKPVDVCGLEHLQCLKELSPFLRTYGVPKGIQGFPNWIHSWATGCSCLQPCSSLSYSPNLVTVPKQINNVDNGWTKVDIFYKNLAVKYSRTASYLVRDFVVSLGSFANFFLGFGAVAVFDFLVYFFKILSRFVFGTLKKRSYKKVSKATKNKLSFY